MIRIPTVSPAGASTRSTTRPPARHPAWHLAWRRPPRAAHPSAAHRIRLAALVACAATLAACASPLPESRIVPGPLSAAPLPRPARVERAPTGAIFQADAGAGALFAGERRPRHVGDTLKVAIAERFDASQQVATDAKRSASLAAKGPGGATGSGLLAKVLNLDATASGSNDFKGDGSMKNATRFDGQLSVTVVNVLPNGHLVVAGDRAIAMNDGLSVLRFSGIVNPQDIRSGNVVASADTVNARLEVVGRGDVADVGSRNWIQRVLADSLSLW